MVWMDELLDSWIVRLNNEWFMIGNVSASWLQMRCLRGPY